MSRKKHKKLSEGDISNLKKAISKVKDVFNNSHLKDPAEEYHQSDNTYPPTQFQIRGEDLVGRIDRSSVSSDVVPRFVSALSIGGQVSKDSMTLFRVLTAQVHTNPISIGSGITREYTIEATIDGSATINHSDTYEFYFNGGGRQYWCMVVIERITASTPHPTAYMRVIGALNIT